MITTINEFKNEQIIRISCAALACIKIDNKYLVSLNKASLKQGKLNYTPFGGALEYTDNALEFLNTLEPEFERTTNDLRLKVKIKYLQQFENWFKSKKDREVSIDRELIEEMVDETHIFSNLTTNDYKSRYKKLEISDFENNNITTYYFFEIHEIIFNDDKIQEIKNKLQTIDVVERNIELVTIYEIMNGKTDSGLLIADNVQSII